jgi:hypothetical protein
VGILISSQISSHPNATVVRITTVAFSFDERVMGYFRQRVPSPGCRNEIETELILAL